MQDDTDNFTDSESPHPGFLILEQAEPGSAVACRDWDIAHNGWAEPSGTASSESVAEQETAAHANLSPVSPTSTLFDTEGSLTDFTVDSDVGDTQGDPFAKGGAVIRAAASRPLPPLNTSASTVNSEVEVGAWVPANISPRCYGYSAQVCFRDPETAEYGPVLGLHIDTCARNTWGLGAGYHVWKDGTLQRPLRGSTSHFHAVIPKVRDAYEPARIINGREDFLDGTYASFFAVRNDKDAFQLSQWFQYSRDRTRSWSSPLNESYYFGIADQIHVNLHVGAFDGTIGLAFYSKQHGFIRGDSNAPHGGLPSFISAIKGALPLIAREGGHILYFCLKRKYIEEGTFASDMPDGDLSNKSWMSINEWPCSTAPKWSPRIPICSTNRAVHEYLWKVELLSIAFSPHDRRSDLEPDFVFKFPGPIHVLFDTGTTLSWFPPELIRYLRTTVFPLPENSTIDNARGNMASSINPAPEPEYYIPANIDLRDWTVRLEFKGRDGTPFFVTCPAYPFLGSENPEGAVRGGHKEGLLFCAQENWDRFILGANFFQSMLVALHAPDFGSPYVRLAWPRSTRGTFVPPPIDWW